MTYEDFTELVANVSPDVLKLLQKAGFDVPGEKGADVLATTKQASALRGPASNKHHAVRTNGYPSKKHAKFAGELELRKKSGEVWFWLEEVAFKIPGRTPTGRQIIHRVDFMVFYAFPAAQWKSWELVEVKGRDLPLGRLKRTTVEELYNVKISVI